jgi:hypothetical protein
MNFFDNCGFINGEYVGFSSFPSFPKREHFLKTMVLQNERYRPDLISYRLFGTVYCGWILDEMNNFYHGFKDYEIGREIFYLKKGDLEGLGIIR